MKRAIWLSMLFCALCVALPMANAQAGSFDVSMGLGNMHDKSNGFGLDFDTLAACSPATDAACSTKTSSLSGVAMGFHGEYMLTSRYGVGGSVVFQPVKQNYADFNAISQGEKIKSRLTFYDINGVARPYRGKNVSLQVEGGIGGANLRFYDVVDFSSVLGSVNNTQYISSANHFDMHAGVGVPIALKYHVFVRPQFDVHYVPNLDQQYGRNVVTQAMVWVGYTFGGK